VISAKLNETLSPVYDAVDLISKGLSSDKTLIGFCGAPWTVATYMIEGGTSAERANSRLAAFAGEPGLTILIEKLVESSVEYLGCQIEAGAEVVQIFDTWAGDLSGALLEKYCFTPIGRMQVGTQATLARCAGYRICARRWGIPDGFR
jgi:uroporphyrinogen decarboxylase